MYSSASLTFTHSLCPSGRMTRTHWIRISDTFSQLGSGEGIRFFVPKDPDRIQKSHNSLMAYFRIRPTTLCQSITWSNSWHCDLLDLGDSWKNEKECEIPINGNIWLKYTGWPHKIKLCMGLGCNFCCISGSGGNFANLVRKQFSDIFPCLVGPKNVKIPTTTRNAT